MNTSSKWIIPGFFTVWAMLFVYILFRRLRQLRGKPCGLDEPPKGDLLFDESYASAQSHKSTFTRLGGGTRCMRISITRKAVLIRPHFPFSIVGADADLIHDIPLLAITDVSTVHGPAGKAIALSYTQPEGDRRIDLVLKRPSIFLSVLSSCLNESKPVR